jgi:PAS domain S-box-containing protein
MKSLMTGLLSMSIRAQILLLAFIVAVPAAGIIVYSGVQMRADAIYGARRETLRLADTIAAEQQNLLTAAQQAIMTLAQLPEVKKQNAGKVQPILRDILKVNTQYSNIFMTDRNGVVWATAVPQLLHQNVSDRFYFKKALASGQLSSGEYVISRATTQPTFNVAYPLKNERGATIGVIGVGFVLDVYKQVLERAKLPAGASFLLLDHKGVVLYRPIKPGEYIGRQYDADLFKQMQEGPDVKTVDRMPTISGDIRILTWRKLRLPGEQAPYMYIRAGIPFDVALSESSRALALNLALVTSFLALAVFFAWLIGKRSIADRVTLLENASRQLAEGDLHVRVSDLVAGGELGRLGQTFDKMARQLLLREQALVESERNYRDIFNTTKDALFVHDAGTGNIIEINKTVEELYGYSRAEILQRTVQDLSSGEPPYSMREAREWIRKTVEEGPQHFEWLARRKNGELFWIEVVQSVTRIGGAGRVLAVERDISDRKDAEGEREKLIAQLREANAKLQAIDKMKSDFISVASHELRTPLSTIKAFVELVVMKPGMPEPQKTKIMNTVNVEADRLALLIADLLDLSRIESGLMMWRITSVSLEDIIRNAVTNMGPLFEEKGLRLTTAFNAPLDRLSGDHGRLLQVVTNILSNAVKFTPQGGAIDVVVRRETAPRAQIVVEISDTGKGIPAGDLELIFEKFHRSGDQLTSMIEGTGLGLAIARQIVEYHGGRIWAESTPGRGSVFTVALPLTSSITVTERPGST